MVDRSKMNKKAVFFTFIAVLLLALLVFSFSIHSRYSRRTRSLVIETRVHTMNSFMKDLDKDIERALFITSHRSILSIVEYISSDGEFIDDFETRFNEVIINGTIEGETQTLMSDTTFIDWTDKMKLQGGEINLNIDFKVNNIVINHSSPWDIAVYINVSIYALDLTEIASWNVSKQITALVPIEGFEDPTYSVNTLGKMLNTINKTPYTDFVNGVDTSNLQAHTVNSYYLEWSMAPSFLMRLEGDLSSSPYGIESLVDLQELIDQGESVNSRSVVDHIYWSNKSVTSHDIDYMPSWFMMDDELNSEDGREHLELYEVDGIIS